MKLIYGLTICSMIMVALQLSGCDESPSPESETEPKVILSLTADNLSGGDQSRWMIRAVASNVGGSPALYFPAHYSEIGFAVYDEAGTRINVYDPARPDPRPPDEPLVLRPGTWVESEVELDGRYWDSQDVEHMITPGVYLIKASLTYFSDRDETQRTVRREIEIVWE